MNFRNHSKSNDFNFATSFRSDNITVPNQALPLKDYVVDALAGRPVQQVQGEFQSDFIDVTHDLPDESKLQRRFLTRKQVEDMIPIPDELKEPKEPKKELKNDKTE